MKIRTYYWNKRKVSLYRFYRDRFLKPEKKQFKYGNAGDIFNVDLIRYLYGKEPTNIGGAGNRLLLVGSIMNVIKEGDVLCGIGHKGNDLGQQQELIKGLKVYGVRGPLTKKFLQENGNPLEDLKFELDPGLLIKEVYGLKPKENSTGPVIFIPHYRDNWVYKSWPKGIKFINIDNHPKTLAKAIMNSRLVYASSLHGIIFAHALGKECVFVAPQTDEPIHKYKDYYLSVGLDFPNPLKSIHEMDLATDIRTKLDRAITEEDFHFPELSELTQFGLTQE